MLNETSTLVNAATPDEQSANLAGGQSRRTFLKTSAAFGGGLLLTVTLPAARFSQAAGLRC